LEEMRVGDVCRKAERVPSVAPSTRFEKLRELVLASEDATLPVVDDQGRLVGLVTAEQLRPVFDERQLDGVVVASDVAAPPVALLPDDDLYRAHELFRESSCPQLPVIEPLEGDDPRRGRILGMLDYRDMMRAYEVELARRREA
ncbi:MAG TPA: CBS domain-containing protein, partial [Myxococcota bacterium]|nr:CBS domain-containing protein [Myxococcota bacterium]